MNVKNSSTTLNDMDEVPPLTEEFFSHAKPRRGLKDVSREEFNAALAGSMQQVIDVVRPSGKNS